MAASPAGSTCCRRWRRLAYEGRRRALFETEFIAALKLLDRGTPRYRLKGSWAGATGYPQFMPSAVLRLAVDGDGDGSKNIWASEIDGLASIANYLREAGWKPNVHWGIPVRVPASFNRRSVESRLVVAALPAGLQAPQPVAQLARMARARDGPRRIDPRHRRE